ncbi:extracellular metalloproteinase [Agarilytica rhodophyticola]|uniref:extracellular metalloproteinase n=1 Tax=Agarilytica rhodophyticola TaxID=1737490 RepID=UPI001C1F9245|nr:M36 family metallopeptidase [Agarilytica rhodophyticola]
MRNTNYRDSSRNSSLFKKNKCAKIIGSSLLSIAISIAASSSYAVSNHEHAGHSHGTSKYGRNIDNRLAISSLVTAVAPENAQLQSIETMRQQMPGMLTTFNKYGATSSIVNPTGNIMPAPQGFAGQNLETVAKNFITDHVQLLGLTDSDVNGMELVNTVKSISGVTHYYYRQVYKGIPVYNGQLQTHVSSQGAISHVTNGFIPKLANSVYSLTPKINAGQAVNAAARALNVSVKDQALLSEQDSDIRATSILNHAQLSSEPIKAQLVLVPMSPGNTALAWNFQLKMNNSWPDITVNAVTGELITSFDQTEESAFRVYPEPEESPIHTSPTPPNDARVLVSNPEDSTASPNGWFDGNSLIMDGNNVHACADTDANNRCDTPQPSCSAGQVCDFPIDLSRAPSASENAAIANLFYWNNIIHDIQYQYGFDEVGGNFQENNFGRGGSGSDSVNADAQDGSGNCNANFSTPRDGSNPRMQMFTCNRANPSRDGDFDNLVIVHEYGHGISTRQVGGPSNSSCLRNQQQGGEGWSDFLGLVYTAKVGDRGGDARGVGSYLFGLATDGSIRPQRYSTNPAINSYTYESVRNAVVPHGVGSVWAQALWEVYWALVDKHGFEENLLDFDINDANEAGNKRMMFYVNEGLKNTSCSPTFIDARDGIIAAANNSFGGSDVCTIWNAFADFGLGTNASTTGSNGSARNGFNIPAQCTGNPTPTPTPGPGGCTVEEGFEAGSGGWSNSSASSCSTGAFVSASPSQQTSSGVVTQVGSANSGSNAYFTATNTSVGVNDVDGGVCITSSPTYSVNSASTLSMAYFHGQRDAGDDANGDFFRLEVSTDGGNTFSTLASNGDSRSTAAWTNVSAAIPAGSNVVIRAQCSDGAGPGDIVECGLDDVRICPN